MWCYDFARDMASSVLPEWWRSPAGRTTGDHQRHNGRHGPCECITTSHASLICGFEWWGSLRMVSMIFPPLKSTHDNDVGPPRPQAEHASGGEQYCQTADLVGIRADHHVLCY